MRTRAERRHNTEVKTSARKKAVITDDLYCGGKMSPNGEACSCTRCNLAKRHETSYINQWNQLQISSFLKSFEE